MRRRVAGGRDGAGAGWQLPRPLFRADGASVAHRWHRPCRDWRRSSGGARACPSGERGHPGHQPHRRGRSHRVLHHRADAGIGRGCQPYRPRRAAGRRAGICRQRHAGPCPQWPAARRMSAGALTYIDDNVSLARHCEQWAQAPLLALDTEFVRETTFYPIPGLLQLGIQGAQFLIDPLTIDDWAPLQSLFAVAIPKVLDACGEDLEVFERLLGCLPQPLFDTQVGAALAGCGYGLGYQALVAQLLEIHVDKEHTRSNWVARPLSAEQCRYASLDVAYLPQMFERISERLATLGRLGWWHEEGERVIAQARTVTEPAAYYRKLSAGFRLRGAQVAALRDLCAWRELGARQQDVPRGRILKDAECL